MVVLPAEGQVLQHLDSMVDAESANLVATHEARVVCESTRGREVAIQTVILADFPWALLVHFRKAAAIRLTSIPLLRFQDGDNYVRPQKASSWDASETWIAGMEAEDAAFLEEYATAAEDEAELVPDGLPQTVDDQADLLKQLQARIVELEAQQTNATATAPGYNIPRELFPNASAAALDQAIWAKLQNQASRSREGLCLSRQPCQNSWSRSSAPRLWRQTNLEPWSKA